MKTIKTAKKPNVAATVATAILFCVLGIMAILAVPTAIACFLAIGVAFWGGLAMLVCNVLLPVFDVHYPLTYMQGGAAGAMMVLAIWFARALFGVRKQ